MLLFDYLIYRLFIYFNSKDSEHAVSNTINFMIILEASLIVPLFIILNAITTIKIENSNMKYYIGIPIAVILFIINTKFIKSKLQNEGLKNKFSENKNWIPIWLIFIIPIIFVFVIPIIYGALNGTLRFPIFE